MFGIVNCEKLQLFLHSPQIERHPNDHVGAGFMVGCLLFLLAVTTSTASTILAVTDRRKMGLSGVTLQLHSTRLWSRGVGVEWRGVGVFTPWSPPLENTFASIYGTEMGLSKKYLLRLFVSFFSAHLQ